MNMAGLHLKIETGARQKAPEGWRTPRRYRESMGKKTSARFRSAAALRRLASDNRGHSRNTC